MLPFPLAQPGPRHRQHSPCGSAPQHVGAGADRDPHGAGHCGQQRLPPRRGHLHGGPLHLHCRRGVCLHQLLAPEPHEMLHRNVGQLAWEYEEFFHSPGNSAFLCTLTQRPSVTAHLWYGHCAKREKWEIIHKMEVLFTNYFVDSTSQCIKTSPWVCFDEEIN